MSQQNITTLQSAINTQLADNTSGDISAADVRDNLINMTDSLLFNSGSQGLTGSLTVTNNITASGDLRFTTAGNAVVRPIIDLTVDGTASYSPNSTNTTAYADYGINVVTVSSNTAYCFRLPQTPVKGKSVTIINNSGINIVAFPSVIGGSINGIVDGFEIIPSDGKSYTYDCYENPLPGGWSLSTSPSTGNTTINTGVINWDYNGSTSSSIGFINDNIKGYGGGQSTSTPYSSIFPSYPQYDAGGYSWSWGGNTYFFTYSHLFPDSIPNTDVWQSVNSIQISTNLSSSLSSYLYSVISVGTNREIFYNPQNPNYSPNNVSPWTPNSFFQQQNWIDFNTNILNPWHTSHPGTQAVYGGYSSWAFAGQTTYSVTPGTFTPSIASPFTSNNVGDPGTLTINLSNFPSYVNTTSLSAIGLNMIGRNYIGSLYDSVEGLLDVWYSQQMGPFLGFYPGAPSSIPNIKFTAIFNVQI
jgi:hypothetical protein